jgi:hypothetical protein
LAASLLGSHSSPTPTIGESYNVAAGWRQFQADIGAMIKNALKLVASAGLLLISTGAWPNPRYGAAIAIGLCVLAAVVIHFTAP